MHSFWAYLTALIFLASAFLAIPVAAQPEQPVDGVHRLGGTFMTGTLDDVLDQAPAGELVPFFETESKAFEHVRYHQLVDDIRVFGASASEHTSLKHPEMRISHADLVPSGIETTGSFDLDKDTAVDLVKSHLEIGALVPHTSVATDPVWFHDGDVLRAAYEVQLTAIDPAGSWSVVVDGASGEVLAKVTKSEITHDHGHETRALSTPEVSRLLSGLPLDPSDPAHTDAHDPGFEPTRADYDATLFQINPIVAMQEAEFRDNPAGIDDGSFEDSMVQVTIKNIQEGLPLQTDRAWVVDALTVPVAGLDLDFRRDDPRFQEVMVLYNVEVALDIMEEQGYGDLLSYEQVRAISRVPSPLPNALATQDPVTGQGYIIFFYRAPIVPPLYDDDIGFASTAEDGEVVVHELGHLFHFAAAPGVSFGAWAEGSADFFAALLLEGDGLSEGYGDPCITEWFAGYLESSMPEWDELHCLRVLDNDLVYPDDATGAGHHDGQFWSGANWEIRQEIGQNASIQLFMESLFLTPGSASNFTVLADTVMHADCGLSDCANRDVIRGSFEGKSIAVSALPEEFMELIAASENATGADTDDLEEAIPAPAFVAVVALVFASVIAVRARLRR